MRARGAASRWPYLRRSSNPSGDGHRLVKDELEPGRDFCAEIGEARPIPRGQHVRAEDEEVPDVSGSEELGGLRTEGAGWKIGPQPAGSRAQGIHHFPIEIRTAARSRCRPDEQRATTTRDVRFECLEDPDVVIDVPEQLNGRRPPAMHSALWPNVVRRLAARRRCEPPPHQAREAPRQTW